MTVLQCKVYACVDRYSPAGLAHHMDLLLYAFPVLQLLQWWIAMHLPMYLKPVMYHHVPFQVYLPISVVPVHVKPGDQHPVPIIDYNCTGIQTGNHAALCQMAKGVGVWGQWWQWLCYKQMLNTNGRIKTSDAFFCFQLNRSDQIM